MWYLPKGGPLLIYPWLGLLGVGGSGKGGLQKGLQKKLQRIFLGHGMGEGGCKGRKKGASEHHEGKGRNNDPSPSPQ